jgi:hypothetical protein
MWCGGCSYYFCWICGGLGNKCWAYKCNKEADSIWATQIAANKEATEYGAPKECLLLDKVSYYDATLEGFDRKMADGDDSARRNMERQLCQILLWCFTYEMHVLVTKDTTTASDYEYTRDHVELFLHVLNMKDVARKMEGMTALDVITNGAVRDIKSKKGRMAKKNNTYSTYDVDCFRRCIAETTLFELCRQSEIEIRISAAKAIDKMIQLLKKRVVDSMTRRQRRNKYRQLEANGVATKNNRKANKGRSKGPWNTGLAPENDGNGSPRRTPWKGRMAAKELKRRSREKYQLETE